MSQGRSGLASHIDLGKSLGTPVVSPGLLVTTIRLSSALHAAVEFLDQHGRVGATHHRSVSPRWPASADGPAIRRLVGTNRGRLELESHALCVEQQVTTAM
jgi:hypothetical protein